MTDFRPPGAGFPAEPPGTWVVPEYPADPNAAYLNAVYPNAAYPNAAYPNAAYPNAVYPYAAPDYSTYPSPGRAWPGGPPSPGAVNLASTLGSVAAGLLVLSGLILLASASAVRALAAATDASDRGVGRELLINGVGNLIAAGLLVGGAVLLRRGHQRCRPFLAAGTVVTVGFSIFWMARHSAGLVVVGAVGLSTLAILATGLAYSRPVTDWLRDRPRPPAPEQWPAPYPPIAR